MSVLQVTLRQPTQIGDRARSDAVLPTVRHVPGGVVRGALAAAWIARFGEPRPGTPRRVQFLDLFEGGVRYGPLFSGEPFPSLAVLSHKYSCMPECDDDDLDESDHPDPPPQCPQCHSPWEPRTSLAEDNGVVIRRRTSVVMAPTGVAAHGGLFSRDRLPAHRTDGKPLAFTGHLVAADPDLLTVLADLEQIRIGGRRTTHGLATIDIDTHRPVPAPSQRDDGRVVLRLRSPAVLVDLQGRPVPAPGSHLLEPYLGADAVVERSWYRWETVAGWHAASGLPKPGELVVAPGSTYLVRVGKPVDAVDLQRLADDGIGLRRHEGFGDLGSVASLRPGRLGRQAELARLTALINRVAPIRGLLMDPPCWERMCRALQGHATGDQTGTSQLMGLIDDMRDRRVADAARCLAGYAPADIQAIMKQEGWK